MSIVSSLCNCWIMRCNKNDLCFLVLHLKLCVLALIQGLALKSTGIVIFKYEVTTPGYLHNVPDEVPRSTAFS
jgi:hypothetical protein